MTELKSHHGEFEVPYEGRPTRACRELPTCSVIIPLKDDAAFLEEQLAGLAAQTFHGWWEVVIADNGSRDGSPQIARRWSERLPNLRLVDASSRPGAAHARNVGSRAAKGKLLAYCDADDVVGPRWLEALAERSLVNEIVAGRQDDACLNPPEVRPYFTTFNEPRADLRAFHFLPWTFGGNIAVRREAFDAVGGWNEDYIHSQDLEFCWRLQLAGFSWGYAADAVVHYRQRDTLRAYARQRYRWGRYFPMLYADFRQHGLRREPPSKILRAWFWIGTRTPFLLMGGRRRRFWIMRAADRVGRLVGSAEHRVWFA